MKHWSQKKKKSPGTIGIFDVECLHNWEAKSNQSMVITSISTLYCFFIITTLCLMGEMKSKSISHSLICRSEQSCLGSVFPTADATQDNIHCWEFSELLLDGVALPSKRLAASWRESLKMLWQAILHKWLAITVQSEIEKWTDISTTPNTEFLPQRSYTVFSLISYSNMLFPKQRQGDIGVNDLHSSCTQIKILFVYFFDVTLVWLC